jgi:hypothetical protein
MDPAALAFDVRGILCSASDALRVLHTVAEALSIPVREVAERLVASAARSRPSWSACSLAGPGQPGPPIADSADQ